MLPTIPADPADAYRGTSRIDDKGVNLDVDSQQEPELFKYDDYDKVLKQMYEKMDVNHRLNRIGMTGMGKAKKVTKKVTSEGRKARKSNAPGCGKEDVAPIGTIALNAKALIGVEEVKRHPTTPQSVGLSPL
ncbi:unnamed protein product [Calypogeia fissa]